MSERSIEHSESSGELVPEPEPKLRRLRRVGHFLAAGINAASESQPGQASALRETDEFDQLRPDEPEEKPDRHRVLRRMGRTIEHHVLDDGPDR